MPRTMAARPPLSPRPALAPPRPRPGVATCFIGPQTIGCVVTRSQLAPASGSARAQGPGGRSEAHCRQLGAFLGHKGVTMISPPHLIRTDGGATAVQACRLEIASLHLMMMIPIR